jgi:4-hydroxy-2-oxoheptanedioate aldolase
VYIGVYDVSQSVGAPGDLMHREVVKVIAESVRTIEHHGVAAGSVARDREYLRLLWQSGFRFLSYRVDSAILRDGVDVARQWYDALGSEQGAYV